MSTDHARLQKHVVNLSNDSPFCYFDKKYQQYEYGPCTTETINPIL
jgi:hypothetical protein